MKIFKSIDNFPKLSNAVVTVGSFDGVHLGHQHLLARVKQEAAEIGGESVVVTFDPHPRQVLHPESNLLLINDLDNKLSYLKQEKIDCVVVIPFTIEFSKLSPIQFLKTIIADTIGAKVMVMGPRHTFGKDRAANHDNMLAIGKEIGIKMVMIEEFTMDDSIVSSTEIRKYLKNGEMDKAEKLLKKHTKAEENLP
ncbi:MAG: adenylyltransferase/cytidyltransferase family protein [Bacteroidales bacterium]|jgi:riboflavin kinase/FMN adenylyltransferase|nr:adenylyltransferase/cytidyltransferase family protein [Bacteroidales bacterium]